MTEQCAQSLSARGVPVIVVNRTLERAVELAAKVGGTARSLDEFRASPDAGRGAHRSRPAPVNRCLCAPTSSGSRRAAAPGSPRLSSTSRVPAEREPGRRARRRRPTHRHGRDQRRGRARRERVLMEFADARAIVDAALTEMRRHAAERLVGPMIAQLRLRYRHTALEGVERLFERELAGTRRQRARDDPALGGDAGPALRARAVGGAARPRVRGGSVRGGRRSSGMPSRSWRRRCARRPSAPAIGCWRRSAEDA